MKIKRYLFVGILTTMTVCCFAQQNLIDSICSSEIDSQLTVSGIMSNDISENHFLTENEFEFFSDKGEIILASVAPEISLEWSKADFGNFSSRLGSNILETNHRDFFEGNMFLEQKFNSTFSPQERARKNLALLNDDFFEKNRRNIYSSMWAFASLNYLYCDLVAFMDKDVHSQYHSGNVGGMKMTPEFLTGAALMMQISIANVFLPQVIKNDKTLKWVQIASGITMSLIQSATLFAGKPTPYYTAFSALEIGATTFITINALKWKTSSKKHLPKNN